MFPGMMSCTTSTNEKETPTRRTWKWTRKKTVSSARTQNASRSYSKSRFYWRTNKKGIQQTPQIALSTVWLYWRIRKMDQAIYFGISRFWCVTINYACYGWPNFWSMARLREFRNKRLFQKSLNPLRPSKLNFSWKIMMLNSNHDDHVCIFRIFQHKIMVFQRYARQSFFVFSPHSSFSPREWCFWCAKNKETP